MINKYSKYLLIIFVLFSLACSYSDRNKINIAVDHNFPAVQDSITLDYDSVLVIAYWDKASQEEIDELQSMDIFIDSSYYGFVVQVCLKKSSATAAFYVDIKMDNDKINFNHKVLLSNETSKCKEFSFSESKGRKVDFNIKIIPID